MSDYLFGIAILILELMLGICYLVEELEKRNKLFKCIKDKIFDNEGYYNFDEVRDILSYNGIKVSDELLESCLNTLVQSGFLCLDYFGYKRDSYKPNENITELPKR